MSPEPTDDELSKIAEGGCYCAEGHPQCDACCAAILLHERKVIQAVREAAAEEQEDDDIPF